MAQTVQPWTAEELSRLPEGWRYEIDEGELIIMAPPGFEHGEIAVNVGAVLRAFVREHRLGTVVAESGFRLRRNPDTLRGPDIAVVGRERLAQIPDRRRYSDVPPDIVVQIVSPSEPGPTLARKVGQYLRAGVRAVWVIDPEQGTWTRHASAPPIQQRHGDDALIEEPVLPGFCCRLGELLGR